MPSDAQTPASAVLDDLQARTLSHIQPLLARLVYVASTRDYNSGVYYHDGLEAKYDALSAQLALATCHESLFRELLKFNISQLVDQLETYLDSIDTRRTELVSSWQRMRTYQILIPAGCDRLSAELFSSNMKLALAAIYLRGARTASA